MRILFDQGTPAPLRRALTGHTLSTAYEMGWMQMTNGALLRAADEKVRRFYHHRQKSSTPTKRHGAALGDSDSTDDELADDPHS
jgi:hypothetical protein